jgi:hypothetical protein
VERYNPNYPKLLNPHTDPPPDFQCANCVKNGALSATEKMTLRVLLLTSGTTIASLLFFTHNFGLW